MPFHAMRNTLYPLLLGLAGGLAGAALFASLPDAPAGATPAESNRQAQFAGYPGPEPALRQSSHPDFAQAAQRSTASVVYIKTFSAKQYRRYTWADMFFGRPGASSTQKQAVGSGSGVIFSDDGYVVTNHHVIEGADEIEVIHQKQAYKAKLVGADPSTDLALLKVEAQGLPAAAVGTSKTLQVGEWVLAVGNPFNLTSTVTAGIVSAKGRKINILDDVFPIESFIQTDAAINPGNSGGALVNQAGELVGINTAILSQTGSYSGYGFAVPIDIVVKVVSDLRQYGQVQKAFMGLDVMDIDAEVAGKLGLPSYDGVLVTQVEEQGAAAGAGLLRGDVLVSIDGAAIDSEASFDEHLSYYRPGAEVKVGYWREGKRYETPLTLTNVEGNTGVAKREVFEAASLGAAFEVVPKVERQKLGIESGLRITDVQQGLIRRMGLEKGFIIVGINNSRVETPQELADILERIRGRVVLQGVNREGKYQYFSYFF
jgi:Do/DeqQ family serine protease